MIPGVSMRPDGSAYVFVSYASVDRPRVLVIAQTLLGAGVGALTGWRPAPRRLAPASADMHSGRTGSRASGSTSAHQHARKHVA